MAIVVFTVTRVGPVVVKARLIQLVEEKHLNQMLFAKPWFTLTYELHNRTKGLRSRHKTAKMVCMIAKLSYTLNHVSEADAKHLYRLKSGS